MAYVDPDQLKEAYEQLFRDFRDIEGEFKYVNKINRMIRDDQRSLVLDYQDLILMDDIYDSSDLSDTLLQEPRMMIEIGSEILADFVKAENPEFYSMYRNEKFFVRFNNIPRKIKIRDIRANDVDDIYWLEGIIIRTTEIKSIIEKAVFECDDNGHEIILTFEDGVYSKPQRCSEETCSSKKFYINHKASKMVDWQFITLQERPEDLPPGASPKSIPCQLTEDVVNAVRPGDRVNIGGIIRSRPSKTIKSGQVLTFDNWIEVNYVESSTKEDELTEITPDEEQEFLEMARDHHIFDHLLNSLAPQIHGLQEVKKAALLMLFGGVDKAYPDGFSTRGQPNVLLVGDPGVAKSQLLRYVQSIAPRGLYTSGKGSSAAGLTAAIIRDPETGEITLEAGAMVLADRGVCLIDEFDKMNENDRSAIHEAMEQHSYHPNVEIAFADGSISKIGDFVDNLFEIRSEDIIEGINCEILPLQQQKNVLSTDFEEYVELPIDRVSRHEAPDYFYQIAFDNGRDIIVTPDHPMYTYDHGILTLEASKLEENMFVPGPREITYYNSDYQELYTQITSGKKNVTLPTQLDEKLGRFLGYLVAEGFSYDGSSAEIGLSNSNPTIIEDMKSTINQLFGFEPIDYTKRNRILRIISRRLYDFMEINFPQLLQKSYNKRIPRQIFSAPRGVRIAFLHAAFIGDGSVETETCGYSTNSVNLAYDYQDLLLTLGIHSRIHKEKYYFKNGKEHRYRYKIYIRGESLEKFESQIIPKDTNSKLKQYRLKLQQLVQRSRSDNRNSDSLPGQVATIIKDCINGLGLSDDGYLYQHINYGYSINRAIVMHYLELLNKRYSELITLEVDGSIGTFRDASQFSQQKLAQIGGITRSKIDYYERGGYTDDTREEIVKQISHGFREHLVEIRSKIDYLENLVKFRWSRVKSIKKIPNKGTYKTKWVYDVTIEPTRSFISHGQVLHNTVSVAKAGIVATLNARTGVLAAANPKYGRYEENRPFNENVNLSPAILSRFDLVFIMRDIPEEERDGVLADHILKLHRFHGSADSNRPPMTEEKLKKYIAYAKRNFHPQLSQEASELLESFYVNMRNSYGAAGDNPKDRITITARQLEGIIRLAEARARASLKTEVTKNDAQFAIDLMEYSLSQIARDPETGTLDIDALYSGQTQSKRSRLTRLQKVIDFVYKDAGGPFSEEELIEAALTEGLSEDYVTGAIRQMVRDGALYQPRRGQLDKP